MFVLSLRCLAKFITQHKTSFYCFELKNLQVDVGNNIKYTIAPHFVFSLKTVKLYRLLSFFILP